MAVNTRQHEGTRGPPPKTRAARSGNAFVAEALLLAAVLSLGLPLPVQIHLALLGLGAGLLLLRSPYPVEGLRAFGIAALAFGAATLGSVAFSIAPQRSILVSLGLLPAFVLCVAVATRHARAGLWRLAAALSAQALVISCVLLWIAYAFPLGQPADWIKRGGYFQFAVPNDLVILCLLAPFSLHLLFARKSRLVQAMAMLSLLTSTACIIVYQSRGGLLLLAVAAGLFLLRLNRRAALLTAALLAAGAAIADGLLGFPLATKFSGLASLSTRIPAWLIAWEMFLDAPLFGQGPGAFSVAYNHYASGLHLPGWVVFDPRHMPWAHQLYLELLAERGLAGLLTFGVLVGLVVARVRVGLAPGAPDGGRIPLLLAVGYSLALALLAGLFEVSLLRYWFLMMLALLTGLTLACSTRDGESPDV